MQQSKRKYIALNIYVLMEVLYLEDKVVFNLIFIYTSHNLATLNDLKVGVYEYRSNRIVNRIIRTTSRTIEISLDFLLFPI